MANTNELNIGSFYRGVEIQPIAVYGIAGVLFETEITGDIDGRGYYYFSNDLPNGLNLTQPTNECHWCRITGAFQQSSLGGVFHIIVRDDIGQESQCTVQYEKIKTPLSFQHFAHFDYNDGGTINQPLAPHDLSTGICGDYDGTLIYSITGENGWSIQDGVLNGVFTSAREAETIQVTVADKDIEHDIILQSAAINIYRGPIYDKPRFQSALCLDSNNQNQAVIVNDNTLQFNNDFNPFPTRVGKTFEAPIRLKVIGGKPFDEKIKYQFFAFNFPRGLTVVYDEYGDYNCLITGTCLDTFSGSDSYIIVKDSAEQFATVKLFPQFNIKAQVDFEATGSVNIASGYQTQDTPEIVAVSSSYTITIVDSEYEPVDPSSIGISVNQESFFKYLNEALKFNSKLKKISVSNAQVKLNISDDISVVHEDETLQFTGPGSQDTYYIQQQFTTAFNTDQTLYLEISDGEQTTYYPFTVGEVYPTLEWKIGYTGQQEIDTIYIEPEELDFTQAQGENGKIVKIYLVKKELLDKDPLAQQLLIENNTDIKSQHVSQQSFTLSDKRINQWQAWAKKFGADRFAKYGVTSEELNAAQNATTNNYSGLSTYLNNRYRQAGYIFGGKPPYTISVQRSSNDNTLLTSKQIENFEIVSRENGRDLKPEEIYFRGKMTSLSKTPTNAIVVLSDSLGQKVSHAFGLAQIPKIPLTATFINSCEDYDLEIINEYTKFQNWPFLVISGTGAENITCVWNGNTVSKYGLTIQSYFTTQGQKYFCLNGTVNFSEAEITNFLSSQNELGNLYEHLTISNNLIPTGEFSLTNIINLSTQKAIDTNNQQIVVSPSVWGTSFPGLQVINVNNQQLDHVINNPFFKQNLSNWEYSDNSTGITLQSLGLTLNKNGSISGTITKPTSLLVTYLKNEIISLRASRTAQEINLKDDALKQVFTNDIKKSVNIKTASITQDSTVIFQLLYEKMQYYTGARDNKELGIPRIEIARAGFKPSAWQYELNGVGANARLSGGCPPFQWSIEKNVTVTFNNQSINLFTINSTKGTLFLSSELQDQYWNTFKTKVITRSNITIKITDAEGNVLIQSVNMNGYGAPVTSLQQTQDLDYFTIGYNTVGANIKNWQTTTKGGTVSNYTTSEVDLLSFLSGGCLALGYNIDQYRRSGYFSIAETKVANYYSLENLKYGGKALKIKETSANNTFDYEVTLTDLLVRDEKRFTNNNALNAQKTFYFKIHQINPQLSWKSLYFGIKAPIPWDTKTQKINLLQYLSYQAGLNTADIVFEIANGASIPNNVGSFSIDTNSNLVWNRSGQSTKPNTLPFDLEIYVKWRKADNNNNQKFSAFYQIGIQQFQFKTKVLASDIVGLPTNSTITRSNSTLQITIPELWRKKELELDITNAFLSGSGSRPFTVSNIIIPSVWSGNNGGLTPTISYNENTLTIKLKIITPEILLDNPQTLSFQIIDSGSGAQKSAGSYEYQTVTLGVNIIVNKISEAFQRNWRSRGGTVKNYEYSEGSPKVTYGGNLFTLTHYMKLLSSYNDLQPKTQEMSWIDDKKAFETLRVAGERNFAAEFLNSYAQSQDFATFLSFSPIINTKQYSSINFRNITTTDANNLWVEDIKPGKVLVKNQSESYERQQPFSKNKYSIYPITKDMFKVAFSQNALDALRWQECFLPYMTLHLLKNCDGNINDIFVTDDCQISSFRNNQGKIENTIENVNYEHIDIILYHQSTNDESESGYMKLPCPRHSVFFQCDQFTDDVDAEGYANTKGVKLIDGIISQELCLKSISNSGSNAGLSDIDKIQDYANRVGFYLGELAYYLPKSFAVFYNGDGAHNSRALNQNLLEDGDQIILEQPINWQKHNIIRDKNNQLLRIEDDPNHNLYGELKLALYMPDDNSGNYSEDGSGTIAPTENAGPATCITYHRGYQVKILMTKYPAECDPSLPTFCKITIKRPSISPAILFSGYIQVSRISNAIRLVKTRSIESDD